jgi:hypothetical protein
LKPSGIGDVEPNTIAKQHGVPLSHVRETMTVGEFGELCAKTNQIRSLLKKVGIESSVEHIASILNHSKSHELEWLLRRAQRKHPKTTGSNLGDAHIASMAFYLDAIHVDKRTAGFLTEIGRKNPVFKECSTKALSLGNYKMIPHALDRVLESKSQST